MAEVYGRIDARLSRYEGVAVAAPMVEAREPVAVAAEPEIRRVRVTEALTPEGKEALTPEGK